MNSGNKDINVILAIPGSSDRGFRIFRWISFLIFLHHILWVISFKYSIKFQLSLKTIQTKRKGFANSVDPDEMAHNEPSHLDLHCLLCLITRHLIWIFNICHLFFFLILSLDYLPVCFHFFNTPFWENGLIQIQWWKSSSDLFGVEKVNSWHASWVTNLRFFFFNMLSYYYYMYNVYRYNILLYNFETWIQSRKLNLLSRGKHM